jgi:4-hydroxy-3-polyprenylbenzoate decarboxylase
MCIDGTKKFDEEKEDGYQMSVVSFQSSAEKIHESLINSFPEIKAVNSNLLGKEIPCIIVAVQKKRTGHIRELHEKICASVAEIENTKIILYVEHTVDPNDITTALWRFCNNLDPKRDHITGQTLSVNGYRTTVIGFDGTRKTKEFDNFQRDWPNIIVADDATIKAVDEKWEALNVGKFIASPSLKFKNQLYGEEAAVH